MLNNLTAKIKFGTLWAFFLALYAFFSLKPYFLWGTYSGIYGEIIFLIAFIISIFFSFASILLYKTSIRKALVSTAVSLFIAYTLVYGNNSDYYVLIQMIKNIFPVFLFVCFAVKPVTDKALKFFVYFFSFFSISAIIFWLGALIGFFDYAALPTIVPLEPIKESVGILYFNSPFSVWINTLTYCISGFCINRLSGPFNEPGLMGTFCFLILVVQEFNLKRGINIIVLISGILTFSLFFYIGCLIFLCLKKFKAFFLILLITICVVSFFKDNAFIERFVINRLMITEDGGLSGDNRVSDEFQKEYDKSLASESIYFGSGFQSHAALGYDVSSWKVIVYNYGVIGCVFYMLTLASVFFINPLVSQFDRVVMFSMFALLIYQRPDVFTFPYIFMLVCYLNNKNGTSISVDNNFKRDSLIKKSMAKA